MKIRILAQVNFSFLREDAMFMRSSTSALCAYVHFSRNGDKGVLMKLFLLCFCPFSERGGSSAGVLANEADQRGRLEKRSFGRV